MFSNVPSIVIPVLSDHKAHWCVNRLSFAYIFNLHTHQELMLGFNHNDLPSLGKDHLFSLLGEECYVHKKKFLWGFEQWRHLRDVEMTFWYQTNQKFTFDVDPVVRRYWTDFKDIPNVNDFVPIMRHLETCRSIKDHIMPIIEETKVTDTFLKYQNILDNLVEVETQGIWVVENN